MFEKKGRYNSNFVKRRKILCQTALALSSFQAEPKLSMLLLEAIYDVKLVFIVFTPFQVC